jgi:16S rRNA (guanine1207-N2)-methyltransferase
VTVLERYHLSRAASLPQGPVFLKPGVRGFPDPPPAERIFRGNLGSLRSPLVDATGTAGAVALEALAGGGPEKTGLAATVLEGSMAALRCARLTHAGTGVALVAGLPWELEPASVAGLLLAPPAGRGNARVAAELAAAVRVLRPDGVLHLALHKDQGAKRYQQRVAELFDDVAVVARGKGWRLIEARGQRHADGSKVPSNPTDVEGTAASLSDGSTAPNSAANVGPPWLRFEAAGLTLESLPGVHSAGKLDPGTALLSAVAPLDRLGGKLVLDLGCGVGVLALMASRAGARTVAVDDDWAAVVSTRHNAKRLGSSVEVLHSDVDSALPPECGGTFDLVLTNPPFHVGKGVRLEVPEAFIAAARRLLRPGGELWLVANRDLPYERMLSEWAGLERVADQRGFKVLRVLR